MEPWGEYKSLLFYLLILTTFFLLFEVSFFIACDKAYVAHFTNSSLHLTIPTITLLSIFFFILIELGLHFFFTILIWTFTIAISRLFRFKNQQNLLLAISLWLLGIITILLANIYLYPNSKFSVLTAAIFFNNYTFINIGFYFLLGIVSIVILLASTELYITYFKLSVRIPRLQSQKGQCCGIMGGYAVLIFLFSLYIIHHHFKSPIHDAATVDRPNIIIIGVDALRPDFLGYFGHEKATPFFDAFLNDATVFSDALTPLARTFPSWTSILTGQHPHHNGVRFNLTNPTHIHLANTLPEILQKHGYKTAYATDETRFSNIDHYFGFDQIITAPMGLNDFIIGTFNDFPLSNLLVNTIVGKWLFPYSYGNRGVYVTYEPKTFLKRLKPALSSPRSKPLFLSVHFCLTHFPNLWAGIQTNHLSPIEIYQASVEEVGKQIQLFIELLKDNNLLQHAILILLSDHGEGLELAGDRITERDLFTGLDHKHIPIFYPPSLDGEDINQSVGHGTDVLGLSQYHVLLAVKLFGLTPQKIQAIPNVVSLLDIKPTVLDILNIKEKYRTDGKTLAGFITYDKRVTQHPKYVFIESDYSPESIRTVYPQVDKVMLDGLKLFQIDPQSTRLSIKDKMRAMILASKQYAVIYNNWILALYPQNNKKRLPILVNLNTGEWTYDLYSQFAKTSPAQEMLKSLKSFYGSELTGI